MDWKEFYGYLETIEKDGLKLISAIFADDFSYLEFLVYTPHKPIGQRLYLYRLFTAGQLELV